MSRNRPKASSRFATLLGWSSPPALSPLSQKATRPSDLLHQDATPTFRGTEVSVSGSKDGGWVYPPRRRPAALEGRSAMGVVLAGGLHVLSETHELSLRQNRLKPVESPVDVRLVIEEVD
jgi:hypothetical protein